MKYLVLFFVTFTCCVFSAQAQDTLHLEEASVLDSTVFKKALGQKIIPVKELLKDNPSALLSDIAFQTPLNISSNGSGLLTNAYLRGTHADGTQLFWNGLPVNSPTLGTSDLNLWSTSVADEILLLPGGSGAELGSGAIGGSILLNNSLYFSESIRQSMDLTTQIGSFGKYGFTGGYNYAQKKNSLSFKIFYDRAENNFETLTPSGTEYEFDNSAFERKGLNMAFQHRFSKALYQTYIMAQSVYREIPDSRSAYNPSNLSEAFEDDKAFRWQNRFTADGWVIEQGFNLEYQRYQDLRYAIDDTNNFFLSATEIQKILVNRKKLKWNAAAYLNYNEAFGTNIKQQQVEYGLRTSLNYRFHSKFTAKLALAAIFLDDANISYSSALYTSQAPIEGFSLPILPSISAVYNANSKFDIRAKSGMVYNIPTLNERYWPGAGNQSIIPETGFSSEIGYDLRLKKGKFNFTQSSTLYHILLNNKIIWLPLDANYKPINIDKTRSRGAELQAGIKYWITDKITVSLSGNFNYTNSIILESRRSSQGVVGKQLIYIPEYTGGSSVSAVFNNLSFYLSAKYNSGAYPTSDNDEFSKLPAFVLLDGGASYKIKLGKFNLMPRVNVYNITDIEYELYAFRPNPGINYQITLKSTLKL